MHVLYWVINVQSIYFSISATRVAAVRSGTTTYKHLVSSFFSLPPKTHDPSTGCPRLFFRLPNHPAPPNPSICLKKNVIHLWKQHLCNFFSAYLSQRPSLLIPSILPDKNYTSQPQLHELFSSTSASDSIHVYQRIMFLKVNNLSMLVFLCELTWFSPRHHQKVILITSSKVRFDWSNQEPCLMLSVILGHRPCA